MQVPLLGWLEDRLTRQGTSVDEVIKLLTATQQIDRKLLNANSVLIYPATPAKQREYQELVSRSFYLANADVKQAQTLIRTSFSPVTRDAGDLSAGIFTPDGLMMAQAVTGKTGFIATDNTYHGNTTAVAHLSTRRPPIGGWPDHIRRVPAPDSIIPLGGSLAAQPQAFAEGVAKAIAELKAADHGFAGIMLCPVFANEGLPEVTEGFLTPTVEVVRRAGGLILCDEVQPGFGRIGNAFWGHERLGFAPDVVTLGKPMANGHPVAAVVTRPDIMAAFREAFGYFNTFAGNPVSMAAAAATLDVIEAEALARHGEIIGAHLLDGMNALIHPQIASLRGAGMFLAMEFSDALGPNGAPIPHSANALCGRIVEGMRARGVLLGRVGRQQHILKLRPPMPFGPDEARDVLAALGDCLESEQTA